MANNGSENISQSTQNVIIGCRLPNGLFMTVGETTIKIKGKAQYFQPNLQRKFNQPDLAFGDSLTSVPRDFAEAWFKSHRDFPAVKNGFLYMATSRNEASAKARDTEANSKTGFTPVDPLDPGFGIRPSDEMLKRV